MLFFRVVMHSYRSIIAEVKVNKFCTDRPSLISIFYVFIIVVAYLAVALNYNTVVICILSL